MAEKGEAGEVVLLRHGETEWSRDRRHTGSRTDLPLTAGGEEQASHLRAALSGRAFVAVLASPLQRARRTAQLAGLDGARVEPDLREWDYGDYEGVTTAEIRRDRPGWYLFADGCPGGETAAEVGARADRVLAGVRPLLAGGDVCLVGHGHCLRVVAARWLGLDAAAGGLLKLDTGTVSVLGSEHGRPALASWNSPV